MHSVLMISFILFNYLLLPLGLLLLAFELYLTKTRASRYQRALHEIADQSQVTGAQAIKSQRDACLTTARLALYEPTNDTDARQRSW